MSFQTEYSVLRVCWWKKISYDEFLNPYFSFKNLSYELFVVEQVDEKPRIVDCHRIGGVKEGVNRPIKITLGSSDIVQRVLRNAGRLKRSEKFKGVYLSADRTVEERTARKELVMQLKQKREREPAMYHFIKNGTIFSRGNSVGSWCIIWFIL